MRILVAIVGLAALWGYESRESWHLCPIAPLELLESCAFCSGSFTVDGLLGFALVSGKAEQLTALVSVPDVNETVWSGNRQRAWVYEDVELLVPFSNGKQYIQLVSLESGEQRSPYSDHSEVSSFADQRFYVEFEISEPVALPRPDSITFAKVELRPLSTLRWLLLGRPDLSETYLPCNP